MTVISRFAHIFLVMSLFFATNSACFCWVQMTTDMGCHVSKEKEACCCNQETEVADEMPRHSVPVLPSVSHWVDMDEVVSVVGDLARIPHLKFLSFAGHQANSLLRSPPNLYVLNATFLI